MFGDVTTSPTNVIRKPSFSLDLVHNVASDPTKHRIQSEFGSVQDSGGKFTLIPLKTQLEAIYNWEIPAIDFEQKEKIVSFPFGPNDWSWQLVYRILIRIYPRGVGETTNQYIGAFLRPVKNETELVLESWSRPIEEFTISIKRVQPEQEMDDNGNVLMVEDLATQISEPEFDEFNEQTTGWGFHDLHPLPLPMDLISDSKGMVTIQVTVSGSVFVNTSTIEVVERIASKSLQADEQETKTFGPEGCEWVLKLKVDDEKYISAYLWPVLTETEEILGYSQRSISTFSLEVSSASEGSPLATKSLTGNFRFSSNEPKAGWSNFAELEILLAHEHLDFAVTITWDPTSLSEYTSLGKTRVLLANTLSEKLSIIEEKDYCVKEALRLNSELETWFSSFQQLESKHEELLALQEETKRKLDVAMAELSASRQDKDELHSSRVQLANVKERLAFLSNHMFKDTLPAVVDEIEQREVLELQREVSLITHQKSDLELQVVKLKNEMELAHRQLSDQHLFTEKAGTNDTRQAGSYPDAEITVETAVENARIEIESCKEAIGYFSSKDRGEPDAFQLAGEIADLSMAQCGADVAFAALCEFDAAGQLQTPEYQSTLAELKMLREGILQLRYSLQFGSATFGPEIITYQESPAQPPPSPVKGYYIDPIPDNERWQQLERKLSMILNLTQSTVQEIEYEEWDSTDAYSPVVSVKEKEYSSSFPSLLSVFSFIFCVYTSVFIVCNPKYDSLSHISSSSACSEIILPGWDSAQHYWHQVCEVVVLKSIPKALKKAKKTIIFLRRSARNLHWLSDSVFDSNSESKASVPKPQPAENLPFPVVLEKTKETSDSANTKVDKESVTEQPTTVLSDASHSTAASAFQEPTTDVDVSTDMIHQTGPTWNHNSSGDSIIAIGNETLVPVNGTILVVEESASIPVGNLPFANATTGSGTAPSQIEIILTSTQKASDSQLETVGIATDANPQNSIITSVAIEIAGNNSDHVNTILTLQEFNYTSSISETSPTVGINEKTNREFLNTTSSSETAQSVSINTQNSSENLNTFSHNETKQTVENTQTTGRNETIAISNTIVTSTIEKMLTTSSVKQLTIMQTTASTISLVQPSSSTTDGMSAKPTPISTFKDSLVSVESLNVSTTLGDLSKVDELTSAPVSPSIIPAVESRNTSQIAKPAEPKNIPNSLESSVTRVKANKESTTAPKVASTKKTDTAKSPAAEGQIKSTPLTQEQLTANGNPSQSSSIVENRRVSTKAKPTPVNSKIEATSKKASANTLATGPQSTTRGPSPSAPAATASNSRHSIVQNAVTSTPSLASTKILKPSETARSETISRRSKLQNLTTATPILTSTTIARSKSRSSSRGSNNIESNRLDEEVYSSVSDNDIDYPFEDDDGTTLDEDIS